MNSAPKEESFFENYDWKFAQEWAMDLFFLKRSVSMHVMVIFQVSQEWPSRRITEMRCSIRSPSISRKSNAMLQHCFVNKLHHCRLKSLIKSEWFSWKRNQWLESIPKITLKTKRGQNFTELNNAGKRKTNFVSTGKWMKPHRKILRFWGEKNKLNK